MDLRTDVVDLWIFHRGPDVVRYLLLQTSQEKAERWFGGGRFWQIPGTRLQDGESVVVAANRCLRELGLSAKTVWAVEHVYPIYNRRTESLMLIAVFAAEVEDPGDVRLTWEHSEAEWCAAGESMQRLSFRGLVEGLEWVRRYITENDNPRPEFRLA